MQDLFSKIMQEYPVRFYPGQKKRFQKFIAPEFSRLGYEKVEVDKAGNVIVGDYDNADVVYTAHYDTPPFSPYITPFTRIFGHIGGTLFGLVPMILLFGLISFGLQYLIGFIDNTVVFRIVSLLSTFAIVVLMFVFPNPKSANDNTSGTLAVYELARRFKDKPNARVAFILFNNEELGLIGSRAFVKQYTKIKGHAPQFLVCNLDCVGAGDHFIFAGKENSNAIMKEVADNSEENIIIKKAGLLTASDNLSFPKAFAVLTMGKSLCGPLYMPQIHMPNDNKLDFALMDRVCSIAEGAARLNAGEQAVESVVETTQAESENATASEEIEEV